MDVHNVATSVFARALGLDPQQRLCSSLMCDFDTADVAHLRALRDRMDALSPDITEILDRHIALVDRARTMLGETPEPERWVRQEATWPLPVNELPDFTACCDFLSDVLPVVFAAFEHDSPDERMRTARAVTKAVFLELAACVTSRTAAVPCPSQCDQACAQRRRRVLLDLAASKTLHGGSLDEALHLVVEVVGRALGAGAVTVRLLDRQTNAFRCASQFDVAVSVSGPEPPFPVAEYPVSLRDLAEARDRAFHVSIQSPAGRTSWPTIVAPVRRWGEVAGVLDVRYGSPPGDIDPDDLHFVAAAGQLAGIALETQARRDAQTMTSIQAAALEAVSNAIVILDPGGCPLWANAAYCRLTGFERSEIVSASPLFWGVSKPGAPSRRFAWDMIASGQPWSGIVEVQTKRGEGIAREWTLTPLRDLCGKVTHVIAVEQPEAHNSLPARQSSFRPAYGAPPSA